MKVMINGQPREFELLAAGATVLDLVQALELKSDRVALELNGDIAARTAWAGKTLADGDKVEIVHFVGGGSGTGKSGAGQQTSERSARTGALGGGQVMVAGTRLDN